MSVLAVAVSLWLLDPDVGAAQTSPRAFSEYEPSAVHPFGQMNPEAPIGVSEYAFMIGDWTCDDRVRDGSGWREFTSFVSARWFLNGYGIVNNSYMPTSASVMTYEYDAGNEQWRITNSTAPHFQHTDWIGRSEANRMVASRPSTTPTGAPMTLQVVFFDIGVSTFSWKVEAVTDAGVLLVREKTCRRTAA